MGYYGLKTLANDLKDLLKSVSLVQDIRVVAATDYENLVRVCVDIAKMPAVAVCMGEVSYDSNGSKRQLKPALLVLDRFKASQPEESESIWDLVDEIADLFVPTFSDAMPPVYQEMHGIRYEIDGIRPVPIDGMRSGYVIELKATETIKR